MQVMTSDNPSKVNYFVIQPLLDKTFEDEKNQTEEFYHKIMKNCGEMIDEMSKLGRSNNESKIKPLYKYINIK